MHSKSTTPWPGRGGEDGTDPHLYGTRYDRGEATRYISRLRSIAGGDRCLYELPTPAECVKMPPMKCSYRGMRQREKGSAAAEATTAHFEERNRLLSLAVQNGRILEDVERRQFEARQRAALTAPRRTRIEIDTLIEEQRALREDNADYEAQLQMTADAEQASAAACEDAQDRPRCLRGDSEPTTRRGSDAGGP